MKTVSFQCQLSQLKTVAFKATQKKNVHYASYQLAELTAIALRAT